MSGHASAASEDSPAQNCLDNDNKQTLPHDAEPGAQIHSENKRNPDAENHSESYGQSSESERQPVPFKSERETVPEIRRDPVPEIRSESERDSDADSDDEQQRPPGPSLYGKKPRRWISEEEWLNIMKEDPDVRPSWSSIFKIPDFLKDTKREAYVPQTFLLGPYHHRSKKLSAMDHYKGKALRNMMTSFNKMGLKRNDATFADNAMKAILLREGEIRDSYEESIDCDGNSLARMLSVDGCFILEVLKTLREPGFTYNPLFGENMVVASNTLKEILMLENQIPWIVLLELLRLENPKDDDAAEQSLSENPEDDDAAEQTLSENPKDDDAVEQALSENPEDDDAAENPEDDDAAEQALSENPKDGDAAEQALSENPKDDDAAEQALSENPQDDDAAEQPLSENPEDDDAVEQALLDLMLRVTCCLFKISSEDTAPLFQLDWLKSAGTKVDHLLDFVHKVIVHRPPHQANPGNQGEHRIPIERCIGRCLQMFQDKNKALNDFESIPPALELKNAGIKFRPCNGGIAQIQFDPDSSTIYLPLLSITYETELLFRNLIAFEMCRSSKLNYVISYVNLMDDLIDSQKDVAFLRSMGILTNLLGSDQEVADLFNGLFKGVSVRIPNIFNELRNAVNANYKNKIRVRLAELWQDHFSSPWKTIALTVAFAILCLTLIQTIYTVKK